MKRKAITLVEVLVSAIILASVVAGVVATFVSVRRSVGKGSERVTAANLARGTLDSLYAEVRADRLTAGSNSSYASGALQAATTTLTAQTLDWVQYAQTRQISAGPTGADYLNGTVTVSFTVKGD